MDEAKAQGDIKVEPVAASEAEAEKAEGELLSGGARDKAPVGAQPNADGETAGLMTDEPKPKHKGLNLKLDNKDPEYKNGKEKVYDFLRDKLHLTVKAMDVVIAILVVLLIVFLIIGVAKGDGGYIA